jgi:hypothetical protein
LAADVAGDQVPFVTELETARWEAVRGEFVTLVEDAELQGRVGYFFSNVQVCARVAEIYFDFAVGVASALTHSAGLSTRLRDELIQELPALSLEANGLDTILAEREKQVAA